MLLVISGPSGVGKSTLLDKLFKKYPKAFGFSCSHTTRKPRPGEVDHVNYHFCTRPEFDKLVAEKAFIEHAEFSGNCYGTSKMAVEHVQKQGKVCVLDVELNGIKSIKKLAIPAKFIFISPPSVQDLEKR
jgi:guanylate kinase